MPFGGGSRRAPDLEAGRALPVEQLVEQARPGVTAERDSNMSDGGRIGGLEPTDPESEEPLPVPGSVADSRPLNADRGRRRRPTRAEPPMWKLATPMARPAKHAGHDKTRERPGG